MPNSPMPNSPMPRPSDQILSHLSHAASIRHLHANQFLFHQADLQSSLFIVQSGLIELAMIVPGRGPVPILSVGPGELIAWSAKQIFKLMNVRFNRCRLSAWSGLIAFLVFTGAITLVKRTSNRDLGDALLTCPTPRSWLMVSD